MIKRRFIQCDVFSPTPTRGNALAVVLDSEGLSAQDMQSFAAWTNLAETTFLSPATHPDADYQVRIFTPTREMPFAGHPTLGSCAAWLHGGGTPKNPHIVRQQCQIGLVDIDISQPDTLAFTAPPTAIAPLPATQLEAIVQALGIARESLVRSAQLNNGPVWQVLELDTAEAVLAVDSSRVRWPTFKPIGLIGAYSQNQKLDQGCDFEVRMLAPSSGMSEDPITGSLNAALAQWMHAEGRLNSPITVSQGSVIGRHGRVLIRPTQAGIQVGGAVHRVIEGTVTL